MIVEDNCIIPFSYLDPDATIAKKLGCILENQETGKPVIKLKFEPKKRRKRDVDKKGKSEDKSNKTTTTKIPMYGCPTNYERIAAEGIDLCIRFGKDKTKKKDLLIEFDAAKKHCEQDGASLLYFSNYNETLNIWKWLGKN